MALFFRVAVFCAPVLAVMGVACSSSSGDGGAGTEGADASAVPSGDDAASGADTSTPGKDAGAATDAGAGAGIVFSEVAGANATTTDFPKVRYGGIPMTGQIDSVLTDSSLDGTTHARVLVMHVSQYGHYQGGTPAPPLVVGQSYKLGDDGSDTTLYGYVAYEEDDNTALTQHKWRSKSGTVVVDSVGGPARYHVVDAQMVGTLGSGATGTFTLNYHGQSAL